MSDEACPVQTADRRETLGPGYTSGWSRGAVDPPGLIGCHAGPVPTDPHPGPGPAVSLAGDLERAVMGAVWDAPGAVSVRQVAEALVDRNLAYTTLMTVADRLYRKGYLHRHLQKRAYVYSATRSRAEHQAALMRGLLGEADDAQAALSHFVKGISAEERAALLGSLHAYDQGP